MIDTFALRFRVSLLIAITVIHCSQALSLSPMIPMRRPDLEVSINQFPYFANAEAESAPGLLDAASAVACSRSIWSTY